MRILTVHSDFMEVEVKKAAIKAPEQIGDEWKTPRKFSEVVVVFTAIEKGDENVLASANALAQEVVAVTDQVKCKNVLLHPWVHLTSKPSDPQTAQKVMLMAETILRDKKFECNHSPFGWYKGFTIKSKGHPLSELSRELKVDPAVAAGCCVAESGPSQLKVSEPSPITATKKEDDTSKSLKQESELKSKFFILDLDGSLHDVEKFNYTSEGLKKLATYETKKVRTYEKDPPHIKLMKEHGLINYEPGSDSGNFRLLPKGRLMKKIMERMITDWCVNYGALEVETPIMYDYEHPSLKKYLNRFPARQYVVLSEEKRFFLRFAACFGQFLIAHDMVISYKQLPLRLFELTRYSFRREQSGELAGLKRLRAFTMPDMHTLVPDLKIAREEFERQYEMSLRWNQFLGLDTEVAFRIQEDFFNENKEWYMGLVRKVGKPILVEMYKERYAYFITKFEFNFIDSMNKASTLSTVQIDVENADTYDINYVDQNGNKVRPFILHASLSGSLERVIYAILEKEAMNIEKGKKGMFPPHLAPTQVRLVPVSEKHLEFARNVLSKIDSHQVRVDLDDRNEGLGKKIRDAQMEWIPYVVVIGDREMESGKLMVNIRDPESKKEMSIEEIIAIAESKNSGVPFEKLSLPREISKRPII